MSAVSSYEQDVHWWDGVEADNRAGATERAIRDLNDQLATLRARIRLADLKVKLLRNRELGQTAPTCLAICEQIDRQVARNKLDAEGWCTFPATWISNQTGIPSNTVNTHAKKLAQWGLFERQLKRETRKGDEPAKGKLDPYRMISVAYYRMNGTLEEALARAASFRRPQGEESTWGGFHPRCPECKGENLKAIEWECQDCGHHMTKREREAQVNAQKRHAKLAKKYSPKEGRRLELVSVNPPESKMDSGELEPENRNRSPL